MYYYDQTSWDIKETEIPQLFHVTRKQIHVITWCRKLCDDVIYVCQHNLYLTLSFKNSIAELLLSCIFTCYLPNQNELQKYSTL